MSDVTINRYTVDFDERMVLFEIDYKGIMFKGLSLYINENGYISLVYPRRFGNREMYYLFTLTDESLIRKQIYDFVLRELSVIDKIKGFCHYSGDLFLGFLDAQRS